MGLRKRKEETADSVTSATPTREDTGNDPGQGEGKGTPMVTRARAEAEKHEGEGSGEKKPNWVKRFLLFLRQVVWELRKTVWPTRKETFQYTGMVLAFVFVMMTLLSLYDVGVGKVFLQIFGG